MVKKDVKEPCRRTVIDWLKKFEDCFATSQGELGRSNRVEHVIDTTENRPIQQHPYPSAWKAREVIQDQVNEMLNYGVIEHSNSPWASPIVLVKKKDGSWRFSVNYRKLNAVTSKDVNPLPRIDDVLSKLEGSHFFSLMDLLMGYWQTGMRPENKEIWHLLQLMGCFNSTSCLSGS